MSNPMTPQAVVDINGVPHKLKFDYSATLEFERLMGGQSFCGAFASGSPPTHTAIVNAVLCGSRWCKGRNLNQKHVIKWLNEDRLAYRKVFEACAEIAVQFVMEEEDLESPLAETPPEDSA